jgi:DNA-binding NarL/FixJ family response regulator
VEESPQEATVSVFLRRILIVEDDALLGSLLTSALGHEGFETECASSALDAKKKLRSFDPDIVLADIDLGEGPSGIDLVNLIHQTRPEVVAIILSKYADSRGAGFTHADVPPGVAYLRKSLVHDTGALVTAINNAARGHVDSLRHDQGNRGDLDKLTQSQREVLHLMALGFSNLEIAKRRKVTVSNVEQRISRIFKAFNIPADGTVVPRVEAIRRYIAVNGIPER